ncbi:hypothetical protein PRZ48_012360 [Zasmidium cellare]|uniref:F-box domain-containing protein n=1 Tax=Zasmidium cellare TaxID=395010 RepID=A0ABR0E4T5_ZASCE|nr:hypothetical protein PRZ48_012360 [Zasmidium cellare]
MTAGASTTAKEAYLQVLPNELIENIAELLPDLDSLRSLRLVCRNVNPVATKVFAQRRFKKLRLVPTRSTVESAIEIFAAKPVFGKAVEHVSLRFHGSHVAAHNLHALENERDDDGALEMMEILEVGTYEEIQAELKTKFKAAYKEDSKDADVPRMLALFPNMIKLELRNLNQANFQSKLSRLSLTAATSLLGTKLNTLHLEDCKIPSDDLRRLLCTFNTIKRLMISVMQVDVGVADWASVICNILVHGKSLESLRLHNGLRSELATRFLPGDLKEETSREFQKKFRTFQNYRIDRTTVTASGGLAIKYACERIGRNLVGDEAFEDMVYKCKSGIEI